MLYKRDKGVSVAARPPEGGPAEGLSASSLPLVSIPHPVRMPDGPANVGVVCPGWENPYRPQGMNKILAWGIGTHREWIYLSAFIIMTEQKSLDQVNLSPDIVHIVECLFVYNGHWWCVIHIQLVRVISMNGRSVSDRKDLDLSTSLTTHIIIFSWKKNIKKELNFERIIL